MFAAAMIIFREMLEIVLIVGIILAATRTVPGRFRWILAGIAGGLGGAALVAFFTESISNFADGMGQELFNAGVLFTAAFFIGWTVLWMTRHAREMRARFAALGARAAEGDIHCATLSVAIALAVWREGAEIVLFSYGMLAAGQSWQDLLLGGLLGGSAGLATGLLLYFGLVSIPAKYFLRVTSALLVLLVAGMVSQGIKFLLASGVIYWGAETVWDSAWLLSEESMLGQGLHMLIGYTDRPSQLQLLGYLATSLTLFGLLRMSGRKHTLPAPQSA
jgi:high-affinity iron transporter